MELQRIANLSLRNGLIEYDKRKGWRGSIKNINYNLNWFKNLENYKLERSINWEIAIIKKIISFQ